MAFPLTPEAALCSCFRILLQDLAPILRSKDLLSFWEIGPELKIFQKKISKVQDLVNNAEERSQEICVSSWMDDLRELSYDMENLVDEMNIERVRMEQQVAIRNQAGTSHHVANIRYTFMDNIADYWPHMNNVKKWMNDALARLDEVLVEANDLELKPQVEGKSPVSSIASRVEAGVGASVDKSDVYGRQKDQEFVIQELLSFSHSSKKNYSTISIVGMAGLGKTTLARLIFHDQRVADFDIRSWACVSDAFDSTRVVKELIEYATGENVSNMAPSALRRRLEDMLKGKKILIVLDDVWEVKAWDSLNVSFTHCAEGSKILVTTRSKNVGNCISRNECYQLKTLEDEDCWTLFKGVAFGEVVDENLEKIGREIVKKCGGVPLAVKVIGSTLRSASAERWENALNNKLWQLEDVASDEIFPALKLSYRYLPSPIKRCFGYLSLFPTDYVLDQYKVVRLWIAEGFIEDREGRSWEDIGHEYYEELQRRCLIQEDNMMHDLIHSLACSVSGKFSHRIANGTGSSMHMESVRHLSVTGEDIDLGALDGNKHLRTLLLLSDHFSEKIFDQGLLRVLELRVPPRLQELPSSVQNLKCLRYLNLSMMGIEYLPDSICELRNLQTLDLGGCFGLRSLPNDIGNLRKLRYLYLLAPSLSSLPDSICKLEKLRVLDLDFCKLTQLPEDIGNLVSLRELRLQQTSISSLPDSICKLHNLRNLDIDGCDRLAQLPEDVCNLSSLESFYFDMNRVKRLPRGIGKLGNLENLCEFVVWKEEGWGIEELNGMNKLKGPLTISHLENVDGVEKALSARLKSKMGIDSLCFKWSSLNDASDAGLATRDDGETVTKILDALEPCPNGLTALSFVNYLGERVPTWMSKLRFPFLRNLTTRDDGETVTKILDALEPCPNGLTTLSFVNYPGERVPTWMSKLRFPFLRNLTMDGLQCVERVMDVELPSLEYLRIENCPKLRAVSMGLPKLVRLDVSRCQELTTLGMIPKLCFGNSSHASFI